MITIKKIKTLKPRVQIRKVAFAAREIFKGEVVDSEYINALREIVKESEEIAEEDKSAIDLLFTKATLDNLIIFEDIYYKLYSALGTDKVDWDSVDATGHLESTKRIVFPRRLLLDRVRSPYNIGAIFRSAESLGVEHIYLRECGNISSPRCIKTAKGTLDNVPYSIISDISEAKGPFYALETGGHDMATFSFPPDATFIIGNEEHGLSLDSLAVIKDKVTIKQSGAKGSLNVSVAVGILLYAWSCSN